MQKRFRLTLGDIFEVPLPNGRKGFIQYLGKDYWGDMVGIYAYITDTDKKVDLDELKNIKFKFKPLVTRIRQGMKLSEYPKYFEKLKSMGTTFRPEIQKLLQEPHTACDWKRIGNINVENFAYPNFIWKEGAFEYRDQITKWYLFNGKENVLLGKRLPREYKNLEYHSSLPPLSIVDFILHGTDKNRKTHLEMIHKG